MIMSLFNQFEIPRLLGVPLLLLALTIPALLMPARSTLKPNQITMIRLWLVKLLTKHLNLPMKQQGHKWALPLTALTLLLLMNNMLGLLPYTFTPPAQLAFSLGLALPLWLMTVITGLRNQPTCTLGHLLPEGAPSILAFPLVIIETASLIIRPIALGVRLAANLTAGHLLVQLISMTTLTLINITPAIAILTTIILILLTALEVAVAAIQAYVFSILLSLYLQENI
uniref:ATP synthase subunit a n=1 Tax=Hemitheconyx caudicinctus TaxID=96741 RepID=I7H7L6_9SAUR|nr:ATP synthase F0 subunit 6 [Hemitheconyx caudicinctus]BAM34425.1 ATPase subunit 6 [Hemitheconyx caudicinctus]